MTRNKWGAGFRQRFSVLHIGCIFPCLTIGSICEQVEKPRKKFLPYNGPFQSGSPRKFSYQVRTTAAQLDLEISGVLKVKDPVDVTRKVPCEQL